MDEKRDARDLLMLAAKEIDKGQTAIQKMMEAGSLGRAFDAKSDLNHAKVYILDACAAIVDAIRAAVAEEREACARACREEERAANARACREIAVRYMQSGAAFPHFIAKAEAADECSKAILARK